MRRNGCSKNHHSVEQTVSERYAQGAKRRISELCCPINYDRKYLKALPKAVLERDYGCGDPSKYVGSGDVVLDLGSGSGKICFIASQIVGSRGKVIGVDMNLGMLALARRSKKEFVKKVGFDNVRFVKGQIQDLALDFERIDAHLKSHPVRTLEDHFQFEQFKDQMRHDRPLIADESVDVVVSNCVLNLVRAEDKNRLFSELFRVLRPKGRIAISDILSDEDVPLRLQKDPDLWSGCISGAFQESEFIKELEQANFLGIRIESYSHQPFKVVGGIEFRSVTVTARKGKEGPCLERNQAVIYKGPWKEVLDDDGHTFRRGERMAVCDKTFHLLAGEPYSKECVLIEPARAIPHRKAKEFKCKGTFLRDPKVTKNSIVKSKSISGAAFGKSDSHGNGSCC